eukprot:scaffold3345_cov162-Skeletonema_menzelii.AAC.1
MEEEHVLEMLSVYNDGNDCSSSSLSTTHSAVISYYSYGTHTVMDVLRVLRMLVMLVKVLALEKKHAVAIQKFAYSYSSSNLFFTTTRLFSLNLTAVAAGTCTTDFSCCNATFDDNYCGCPASAPVDIGMIRKEESVCWITCGDYNLGRLLVLIEGT